MNWVKYSFVAEIKKAYSSQFKCYGKNKPSQKKWIMMALESISVANTNINSQVFYG